MNPVRTCVGCRARAAQSFLLRVVARNSRVAVDETGTLQGRGAWVHPTRECVENSIKRRAFGRALRVAETLDPGDVLMFVSKQLNVPEESTVG